MEAVQHSQKKEKADKKTKSGKEHKASRKDHREKVKSKRKNSSRSPREQRQHQVKEKKRRSHSPGRARQVAQPLPWSLPAGLTRWSMPSLEEQQIDPTLCLVLGAASITPDAIAHESTRLGGRSALVSAFECLASDRLVKCEPWISGTSWGLAFIVAESPGSDEFPSIWSAYKDTGGNMLKTPIVAPVLMAKFFSTHPSANKGISTWTEVDIMHPLLLISTIAKGISGVENCIRNFAISPPLWAQSLPRYCPSH